MTRIRLLLITLVVIAISISFNVFSANAQGDDGNEMGDNTTTTQQLVISGPADISGDIPTTTIVECFDLTINGINPIGPGLGQDTNFMPCVLPMTIVTTGSAALPADRISPLTSESETSSSLPSTGSGSIIIISAFFLIFLGNILRISSHRRYTLRISSRPK